MKGRPELLSHFVNMQDEIEFVQLFYRSRQERQVEESPFKMIYWFEYATVQALIDDVKPDLIIGSTESLLLISLIRSSKQNSIPFLGLQHGFVTKNLSDAMVTINRRDSFTKGKLKTYFKTARFYFSSFSIFKIYDLIQGCKVFYSFFTLDIINAIKRNRYKWLVPNYYVCFSNYSASHYKDIYNIDSNQFIYTGVLYFDDLFKQKKNINISSSEKYYLLIDTNFEEYKTPISREKINRCYNELLIFCKKRNAKLKIKLHPWSYKYTDFPMDADLEFYTQLTSESLNDLILNAEACFGFYSTLSFAVVAFKKLLQIRYDNIYIEYLEEKGISPALDFYTFNDSDIVFPEYDESVELELNNLLFLTDGMAAERLKDAILRIA